MTFDNFTSEETALARAIVACALHGQAQTITNVNLDEVWTVEPDSKVDDDDLSYPVIVHMRGGTIASDGIAIRIPSEVVA